MWDTKRQGEIITVTFDFAKLAESVSNPVIQIDVIEGVDPSASNILIGIPVASGALVAQQVTGGAATAYKFTCTVDAPGGNRYIEDDILRIT